MGFFSGGFFSAHNQWMALIWSACAVVLSLTTWFSATAIAPELTAYFMLTENQMAWLTNGVQVGFVVGAMLSSFFALADIWPILRIMTLASLVAGLANFSIIMVSSFETLLLARFITGMALAMVYPVAMKFIATWFRAKRGIAMGTMVGALTLGSATPHLFRGLEMGSQWTFVVSFSSLSCIVAALIFGFILKEGPHEFPRMRVNIKQIGAVLKNRSVMLANFGYFGHMWELYAMWGWFLAYVIAAQEAGLNVANASVVVFIIIALGAPSCIVAGWLSDRIGRCATTAIAMTGSGLSALAMGFAFAGPTWLFMTFACIWGITVIADSAQFSAAVSELSDPNFVGSALAFQMGVGFAITMITVWLVPNMAGWLGSWQWGFVALAIGPFIGVIAMLKLKSHPDAIKMAGGLR